MGMSNAVKEGPTLIRPFRPVVREFLMRGLRVDAPPPGYDPQAWPDEENGRYFIPPRPDARKSPRARAFWQEAMQGPHVWPIAAPDVVGALFAAADVKPHPHFAGPAHGAAEESSANWSGAYVRPRDFSNMVGAYGAWTVPDVSAPGDASGQFVASVWIGLDGHDPASRSLPQLGTWQAIDRAPGGTETKEFHAWWQWFERDAVTNGSVTISQFPISPGDRIFAIVRRLGGTEVQFYLHNRTTGNSFAFQFNGTSIALKQEVGNINPRPVRIEGRTAEWIVERPTRLGSSDLYPLADFGQVHFSECVAETDSPGPARDVNLARARLMRICDWEPPPLPSGIVSTPARDGGFAVQVNYGGG
jgi:hypothetical protein